MLMPNMLNAECNRLEIIINFEEEIWKFSKWDIFDETDDTIFQVELHLHLDGAVRFQTLIDLAVCVKHVAQRPACGLFSEHRFLPVER